MVEVIDSFTRERNNVALRYLMGVLERGGWL